MKLAILIASMTVLIGSTSMARTPTMNITFGGVLQQECSFVDDSSVLSALNSSLRVLNEIEDSNNSCSSLLTNSRVFLSTYSDELVSQSYELNAAKKNEYFLKQEIERRILLGTYAGELDSELLYTRIDINRYEDSDRLKRSSMVETLKFGSSVLNELEANPECATNFGQHVIAPVVNLLGTSAAMANGDMSTASMGSIGVASQFLSDAISFFSRIMSPSYRSLRDLTESSNYYQSYKCAAKNIDKIICQLEEQEALTRSMDLNKLKERIERLDTEDKSYQNLRDIKRHRFRINNLIDALEKIFSSPETLDLTSQIVGYSAQVGKLNLISKFPPLENEDYIKLLKKEGLPYPAVVKPWKEWDPKIIRWSDWWHRYFYGSGGYLKDRIEAHCVKLAADRDLSVIYNSDSRPTCDPTKLENIRLIGRVVKEVLAPALVDLQREMKRLNEKLKESPNVDRLYNEIRKQEILRGDNFVNEYRLSELFQIILNHTEENYDSPARYFALDFNEIIKELQKLLVVSLVGKTEYFAEVAQKVFDKIATISNNGVNGGILYTAFIESKISSYLDEVSKAHLLGSNVEDAIKYNKFNYYSDLYEHYLLKMNEVDSSGSSNLSLMEDVSESFYKVFGKTIKDKIRDGMKRYKKNKLVKRELLHSCGIFYAHMSSDISDHLKRTRRFCKKLLRKNGGIPLLINDDKLYSLNPKNKAAFGERCFYRDYSKTVTDEKIIRYRQRRN